MKIAIIGAGISGLTAAHRLHPRHEITLFEASPCVGGHTNTVDVEYGGERQRIDTGFIVFNDRTYPNFIALLDELKVDSQPTEMSFSVRCDRTGLEYNGGSLNGLFAQRRNLMRPSFHRMLRDIWRFNRQATALLDDVRGEPTVGEYLEEHGFSQEFARNYLLPMGSAIWSCPVETFARFPMRFIVEFYSNHGLLSVTHRPTWRVVCGGSKTYVDAMIRPFSHAIRLNAPVAMVRRHSEHVEVAITGGPVERFEHVIFACHSDQALRTLADPTDTEREVLTAFPYGKNTAVLHTDASVLPRSKRAWAAWNYHLRRDNSGRATVTYNMNILQRLSSRHVYCVTLNGDDQIHPEKVLRRMVYEHPVFTTGRSEARRRHADLLTANRTSYCGAYWGNGFHEDGVNSALSVCRALESHPKPCTAPSMKERSDTVGSHRFSTSSTIACS